MDHAIAVRRRGREVIDQGTAGPDELQTAGVVLAISAIARSQDLAGRRAMRIFVVLNARDVTGDRIDRDRTGMGVGCTAPKPAGREGCLLYTSRCV